MLTAHRWHSNTRGMQAMNLIYYMGRLDYLVELVNNMRLSIPLHALHPSVDYLHIVAYLPIET